MMEMQIAQYVPFIWQYYEVHVRILYDVSSQVQTGTHIFAANKIWGEKKTQQNGI